MNEYLKLKIHIVVVILILIAFPVTIVYINQDISKQLRETNNPTKHEYDIISIKIIKPFIGENYFEIIYKDSDNVVLTKNINIDNRIKFIDSYENKFIIENPELNGYKLQYTLLYNKTI